jgi:hypothetical protein
MRGARDTCPDAMARSSAGRALVAADPASLLLLADDVANPVLRILLDRPRSRSRPLARLHDHRVVLAIEGGRGVGRDVRRSRGRRCGVGV